ncbi:MAG: cytochrome P460 family protein [Lysobacterales bacterium]
MKKIPSTALFLLACAGSTFATETPEVPYPDGYRDWHHVKSMVIEDGHPLFGAFGGIHHVYANPKAVQGYRTGTFPDGAVIVFDLLEATRADGAVTEGARKVTGVMFKDAEKYAATGGWGFEGFEGFGGGDRGQRVVAANAASACFACHAPHKDRDYVFSKLRD